jgi:hypothetical protein
VVPEIVLTETLTPSQRIAFSAILYASNSVTAFAEPFESPHVFKWLHEQLVKRESCHVEIIGSLGQDVDMAYVQLVDRVPDKFVERVWKAWLTQAVQARGALVRQKVHW